jgi:hypothetical protein
MRFAPKFRTVSKSILFLGIRQRDSAAPLFFAWLDAADMLRSGSVRRFRYRWAREKTNHKRQLFGTACGLFKPVSPETGIFLGEILRGATRGRD